LKLAVPKAGSVQNVRKWHFGRAKIIFEPKLCDEWLVLIGQFSWLSVLAGVLAEKHTSAANILLYSTHFVLSQPPFGSANFNRLVNDCINHATEQTCMAGLRRTQ
jgi:hypothetical protein